ncbi:MAG: DUF3465 domain-containing protein, partial [Candidatus Dormibacteraeota bacterium]|nr:DUF3465 domain-containing protein [Candidatus Dormibacteraeota bacterium]
LSALASALLLGAACGDTGSRAAADDAALHQDIASGRAVEVTFDGTLTADPEQVGNHEHLQVKTPKGDVLEVDHNTTLAPSVPAHAGDTIIVHGLLYIDPGPRAGVHCTHAHVSSGCPNPGWIELGGNYYE